MGALLAVTTSVAEAGPLEVNAIERGQFTIVNKPKRPVLTRNDAGRMANVLYGYLGGGFKWIV